MYTVMHPDEMRRYKTCYKYLTMSSGVLAGITGSDHSNKLHTLTPYPCVADMNIRISCEKV